VSADAALKSFLIWVMACQVNSYEKYMGRTKRWSEDMVARFPEGTFERIDSARSEDEDRTDFIREAVERELKRRERKSSS
jgi:hypothetical protein